MTTIAFRNGRMASDSLGVGDDIVRGTVRKLFRVDGAITGFAGDTGMSRHFCKWFEDGADAAAPPKIETSGFGALVYSADGLFVCSERWTLAEIVAPYAALGSGNLIALGAMAMGADAERAIEVAYLHDPFTRGPVCWMTRDDG